MGTRITNISPDAVAAFEANQSKSNKPQKNSTFDVKNYLDTRLDDGQDSRTTSIRILPIDPEVGFPFTDVIHFHQVRVNKELAKSGWKNYLCLSKKNKGVDHDKWGDKCPYCEAAKAAYNEYAKATDPQMKEEWKKTWNANQSREYRICRVIERGKESDGVKFWRIKIRPDGTDPYTQIMKLYHDRAEAAAKKGKEENIFDLYNGRDIQVTFHTGTAAPSVVYDADLSPLSENEEEIQKWVFDDKKWTDVFTPKEYDYLTIVANMEIPWYDRANGRWISKKDYESEKGAAIDASDEEIQKAEAALAYTDDTADTAPTPAMPEPEEDETSEMFVDGTSDSEDDLPF